FCATIGEGHHVSFLYCFVEKTIIRKHDDFLLEKCPTSFYNFRSAKESVIAFFLPPFMVVYVAIFKIFGK
ncbi:hypothetical protein, partial [Lactovum odontotermitis]